MVPSPISKEPQVLQSSEPDKLEEHHEYPKEPQPPSLGAEAGDAPPSSSLQQPIKFLPILQKKRKRSVTSINFEGNLTCTQGMAQQKLRNKIDQRIISAAFDKTAPGASLRLETIGELETQRKTRDDREPRTASGLEVKDTHLNRQVAETHDERAPRPKRLRLSDKIYLEYQSRESAPDA
ncbi:hypothetical protein B0T10DRAFT_464300 [Thelonectria olida]|uniref:Uncharacterized protein n=1 Tax=Thelonectria olida TaxID=1576542 RepID=A0A9P8VY48_9HYPO|nr:hypothetical protein B0T10DRAFT_464300 [Thelonectria olida]